MAIHPWQTPPMASEPLTLMSRGRSAVLPLANRNASVVVPADGTVTVHWMKPPATFV